MTTVADIKEELAYLRDCNTSLQNMTKLSDCTPFERAECRRKITANNHRIMQLESSLIAIESDKRNGLF